MKRKILPFITVRSDSMAILFCLALAIGCSEPDGLTDEDCSARKSDDVKVTALADRTFTAHLTGDQERPVPVDADGSGQAIFKLSKDGTTLHYKIIVNNVENITQAHIHCGGTEDAGPVIAFLFGFVAEGVTVNGVLAEGDITAANVIPRPDSEMCMGGVADFAQLIEKIKSGGAYVNVHTVAYPGGEIRGQLK